MLDSFSLVALTAFAVIKEPTGLSRAEDWDLTNRNNIAEEPTHVRRASAGHAGPKHRGRQETSSEYSSAAKRQPQQHDNSKP